MSRSLAMSRRIVRGAVAVSALAIAMGFAVPPAFGSRGPDVAVAVHTNTHEAGVGEEITYRIRVQNNGYLAATNVSFFVNLPDPLNEVSQTCGEFATCSIGTLAPRANVRETFVAVAAIPCEAIDAFFHEATLSVSVFADEDTNPANNTDAVTTKLKGCAPTHD